MTFLQYQMVIYAGDGYCRSEAIVAVYLQKKKSAKRIYATMVHSKNNSDGYKNTGILLVRHVSFFHMSYETM